MLVPLTASLYVTGTLDDEDRVLVDVGTGYLIKRGVFPVYFFMQIDWARYVFYVILF